MAAISVIIPVYNCENYLVKCLDSLLAQSHQDFEAVLTDDGSTDASGKICDLYAQRDSRFKVLHTANKGVSYARQIGIENSSGKYISFIDSDDWVEPDMLKILYDSASFHNCDIVEFNFFSVCRNLDSPCIKHHISKSDALSDVVSNNWGVVWRYFLKRDFIVKNDIRFSIELKASEDYLFITECLCKANSFIHIPDALYHYNRNNLSSLTNNRSQQIAESGYIATKKVEKLLETFSCIDQYVNSLRLRKFYIKNQCSHFGLHQWHRCYPEVESHIWDRSLDITLYRRAAYTILSLFGKIYEKFPGYRIT